MHCGPSGHCLSLGRVSCCCVRVQLKGTYAKDLTNSYCQEPLREIEADPPDPIKPLDVCGSRLDCNLWDPAM